MNSWIKAVASFFYVGFLPKAPGTFGSLAGLILAWFLNPNIVFILSALSIIGFVISPAARIAFRQDDPKEFVIDEVTGMMLTVLWLPKKLVLFILGFLIFRVLDIWKPWPIRLIQKNKNALSIMWDDLAAGFFANLILQSLLKFQS